MRRPSSVLSASLSLAFAFAVPAAAAKEPVLSVELNKLETHDKGCRVYVVVDNPTPEAYSIVKLDLVMFQPNGVIGRRIAVDVGPVRLAKKSVKLFDLDGMACDQIGSVLVNDVIECRTDGGRVVADCLTRMVFASVAPAPLTK